MLGEYLARTRSSKALYRHAKTIFAGGVNHNVRYFSPYPLFVSKAREQHLWDEDGNRYTDYWMGHSALILGHSPKIVQTAIAHQLDKGTLYGMGSKLSIELGEEIQRAVPCAEMMRFCNTGAEAGMYLIRLARAYTGKRTVLKIAGGWHGYSTELNTGVHSPYDSAEGAGILPEEQVHVVSVRFNDLEAVRRAIIAKRQDVAAIYLEPVLGAGGCIPADRNYLNGLRELADETGVLLAFDEIMTGFRLRFGGAQEYYKVKPDIATFGKIIGGGLPVALVCGLKEIISMADPSRKRDFVSIGGGTFSENPISVTAGIATVRYLKENRNELYPRLQKNGDKLRRRIDNASSEFDIKTSTTGAGSLFITHFGDVPREATAETQQAKKMMSGYALFMASNGIFFLPGRPCSLSTRHTNEDLDQFVEMTSEFARQTKHPSQPR